MHVPTLRAWSVCDLGSPYQPGHQVKSIDSSHTTVLVYLRQSGTFEKPWKATVFEAPGRNENTFVRDSLVYDLNALSIRRQHIYASSRCILHSTIYKRICIVYINVTLIVSWFMTIQVQRAQCIYCIQAPGQMKAGALVSILIVFYVIKMSLYHYNRCICVSELYLCRTVDM